MTEQTNRNTAVPALTATPSPLAAAFPIVGVGASAGGLEAFTQLLSHLPAEPGLGMVLVQHLDPHHESLLAQLLAKATSLPVVDAKHDLAVERNHVYVIPRNVDLAIQEGKLKVRSRAKAPSPFMPIDTFFRSLAADQGSKAIGIVLSGGGTDGALGLEAIKAQDGITFVQDDKSAKQTSMPRSAVSIGCVDFILSPDEIARELVRVAKHPYATGPQGGSPTQQEGINEIFRLIRSGKGVDFSHYKRTTIMRRIERRMALARKESLPEYLLFLKGNLAEIEALYQDFLILVTTFFRDPLTYQALQTLVFPRLLKARKADAPLRIWVAGCATGEEVYSLAICLSEVLGDMANNTPIKILATDVNDVALDRARSGTYLDNIALDVSPERLRRFFTQVNGNYQIAKNIREMCLFSRHNMVTDTPFANLDLITCRNVLIYFNLDLQKRVLPLFHYALKPSGFLMLGTSETIGTFTDLFALEDKDHKVYSKKHTSSRTFLDFLPVPGIPSHAPGVPAASAATLEPPGLREVQHEAERILLAKYAPASVIVDDELTIVHIHGDITPYLALAPGPPTFNLLKMARSVLKVEVPLGIERARVEKGPIRIENIQLGLEDPARIINMEVIPHLRVSATQSCFLVLFEESHQRVTPEVFAQQPRPAESSIKQTNSASPAEPPDQRVSRLEQELALTRRELASTREYLQAIVEDNEGKTEELKSANEEILSSNEELQSTNEELQTAKEEMQSANEELTTVNEELKYRNVELGNLNDDMLNVLQGVHIPIVMIGRDLKVRRFTPTAAKLFNLIPTDVGRPIGNLRANLDIPDLEGLLTQTIQTLTPSEREVPDHEGHWYSVRVRPYVTADNKIDGAALAVLDIDALKRASEQLRQSRDYADAIIETVSEPLLVLDEDLRVRRANQAFYRTFHLSKEEAEHRPLPEVGAGQWDRPQLRTLLSDILPRNTRFHNFAMEAEFPPVGRRSLLLNALRIYGEGSRTQMILLTMEDATDRKREAERERLLAGEQAARAEAESANRLKDEFLAMLAHELRNPLAPLRNALQVLKVTGCTGLEAERMREMMERQVRHMSKMLDDLLDLSRLTRGTVALHKEPMDLVVALQRAVESSLPGIETRAHTLHFHLTSEPLPIVADPVRLEQVFCNLLNNACKFTRRNGQIWVTSAREANDAVARIKDSGVGIAPEMIERIFDMFTQGQRSLDRSEGGLGLGLTLVRSLVEFHGGSVSAFSQGVGKGSEFVVRIPLSQVLTDPKTQDKETPQERLPPETRFLIVDDNVDSAESMASQLRLDGYLVQTAYEGSSALETAAVFVPQVILLDLGLPMMDGYEVARTLRARSEFARATIIAVTGYGKDEDRRRSQEAGFDHHLVKPVEPENLQELLVSSQGKRLEPGK